MSRTHKAAGVAAVAAPDDASNADPPEAAPATPPPSIDGKGTLINTYA
ncbi:MAG TPA: hypothetical protein VFP84_11830 [Kofleriaceae bacterium]|nr:hypothetical protein [Kofleriaceae bacterium]